MQYILGGIINQQMTKKNLWNQSELMLIMRIFILV
jgi:hypothetical protein